MEKAKEERTPEKSRGEAVVEKNNLFFAFDALAVILFYKNISSKNTLIF